MKHHFGLVWLLVAMSGAAIEKRRGNDTLMPWWHFNSDSRLLASLLLSELLADTWSTPAQSTLRYK